MQIATDKDGKVCMVGDCVPNELNGAKLTVHSLTKEQERAFKALPSNRGGTVFNGAFVALEPEAERLPPSLADQFVALIETDPEVRARVRKALA